MVRVHLVLKEITKLSSKVTISLCISISNAYGAVGYHKEKGKTTLILYWV